MSESGQELMRSWAPGPEMWGPNLRGSLPSQTFTSPPIQAHPQKRKEREMGVDTEEEEEAGHSWEGRGDRRGPRERRGFGGRR